MEKRQSETPLGLPPALDEAKMHDLKRKNLHDDPPADTEQNVDQQNSSSQSTGPIVKRLKKLRCLVCRQKTGLACSYTCRCGNNYCAKHRYAEAHQCSFDYKEAGKDVLRKMHPVIQPQKIDKI